MEYKYGILYIPGNKLLEYNISFNGGDTDFSTGVSCYLSELGQNIWLVDTIEEAERAINGNVMWYNEDYETPAHKYRPEELEVVKIKLLIE